MQYTSSLQYRTEHGAPCLIDDVQAHGAGPENHTNAIRPLGIATLTLLNGDSRAGMHAMHAFS